MDTSALKGFWALRGGGGNFGIATSFTSAMLDEITDEAIDPSNLFRLNQNIRPSGH